ncbi:MAG: hypothetical protein IJP04_03080 [Clostridia bacterium]|nr:hypothetical protein [Clostridia bacterium]
MKWVVIVETKEPIKGTNGCRKFFFNSYNTKKEAEEVAAYINSIDTLGDHAIVRKEE